jgi:hypothetical protein
MTVAGRCVDLMPEAIAAGRIPSSAMVTSIMRGRN